MFYVNTLCLLGVYKIAIMCLSPARKRRNKQELRQKDARKIENGRKGGRESG